MSVFLKNICQFNNCKKTFYTLTDLIHHIENDHLDFDPLKIEQLEEEKPDNLPLSYVLKFSNESLIKTETVIQELDDCEFVSSLNNNYVDFREKKFETRLNPDELTQIFGGSRLFTLDHNHKKPFLCNMKGCEKRYKNVNGIKYHYKKHHKMLIPNFKKSLLKHKSPYLRPNNEGIPLQYSYKPVDSVYSNFEDCDTLNNEYFYKFNMISTSEVHFPSNQVPLQNMSFNYYNFSECEHNEEFLGKNSGFFLQNFEKHF